MHLVHPWFHRLAEDGCCGASGREEVAERSAGQGTAAESIAGMHGCHASCPICSFLAYLGKYILFGGGLLLAVEAFAVCPALVYEARDVAVLFHVWARGPPRLLS